MPPPPCARHGTLFGSLLSVGAVLGGLLIMQSPTVGPLPDLPTGILGKVFGPGDVSANALAVLYGTLCLLAGCVGCYRLLPDYPHCLRREEGGASPPAKAGGDAGIKWSLHTVGLGLAAAVLYGVAVVGAMGHTTNPLPLLCLAGSTVLCFMTLRSREETRASTPAVPRVAIDITFVVILITAFIALNLHDLQNWLYAYVGDDWEFYDFARALARGAGGDPFSQAGVYGFQPVLDSLYQSVVMRGAGIDVVGWRLSSILAAAVPIAVLYVLAYQIGGAIVARLSTLIYATCTLLWAFAHIGYNNNDSLLPMVGAALLCYWGLRGESQALLFAAGACAGAGWYTIYTGRLMIGVLVLLLLTERHDGGRLAVRRFIFLLMGFAMVVIPLLLDNGFDIVHKLSHNSVFNSGLSSSDASRMIRQNAVRGIYAFFFSTAHDHFGAGALFDVVAAAALCIGIALAIRARSRLEARLLLLWFFVTTALTTPLSDSAGVSLTRSMIIVPPAALLAGLGLSAVAPAVRAVAAPWGMRAYRGTLALAIGAILVINLNQFYVVMPNEQYPAFPQLVLIFKAMLGTPHTLFVLPADIRARDGSGTFCDAVDGFRLDPASLVYPSQGRLTPYCPAASDAPAAEPAVQLLLDLEPSTARCTASPSETFQAKQGRLWIFRLPSLPRTGGSYAERLRTGILAVCPRLFASQ